MSKENKHNYIVKAYELIHQINRMPNGSEREIEIYKFDAFISFLYYANYINENDYRNLWYKIANYKDKRYKKANYNCEIFYYYNSLLSKKYDEILRRSDSNLKRQKIDVDFQLADSIFNSFLNELSIKDFFDELNNNNIIATNSIKLDNCVCIDKYDLSYIIIGQVKNTMDFYIAMVNNIGHAYANKLVHQMTLDPTDFNIAKEAIPKLFVLIFLDYIKSNRLIRLSLVNQLIINYYKESIYYIYSAKMACDVLSKQKINHMSQTKYDSILSKYQLSYNNQYHAIGSIIAYKLFMDNCDSREDLILKLPYLIKSLVYEDSESIITKYIDSEGILDYFDAISQKQFDKKKIY